MCLTQSFRIISVIVQGKTAIIVYTVKKENPKLVVEKRYDLRNKCVIL